MKFANSKSLKSLYEYDICNDIPVVVLLVVMISIVISPSGSGCDGWRRISNCTGKSLSNTVKSALLNITSAATKRMQICSFICYDSGCGSM